MEEKINIIEDYLSNLLIKSSNDDYLKLIEDNPDLKEYDELMKKINNGEYPLFYMNKLDVRILDNIINYLSRF